MHTHVYLRVFPVITYEDLLNMSSMMLSMLAWNNLLFYILYVLSVF